MSTILEQSQTPVPSLADAADRYLSHHIGWRPSEYHLVKRGPSADGRHLIIWAIHADDEKRAPHKLGDGKSVSLYVDPQTHEIAKMLRFQ